MAALLYPSGLDCAWFAADARGQIARFTTGGLGPIPAVVIMSGYLFDGTFDVIATLPRHGEACTYVYYPRLDDFIWCSEAGIFTFDCNDISDGSRLRRYELVSSPSLPLQIDNLTPLARKAVGLVVLEEIEFGRSLEIRPDQLGECVTA